MGNELDSAKNHSVLGVSRGIVLDLREQQIRVLGSDVESGRRQIESVQRQCAEPEVDVAVGDSWNHSLALQVDDLGVRRAMAFDLSVGADRVDLVAGDRQRLRPLALGVGGVNVAVQQDGVARKKCLAGERQKQQGRNADVSATRNHIDYILDLTCRAGAPHPGCFRCR